MVTTTFREDIVETLKNANIETLYIIKEEIDDILKEKLYE
jgi:hypothetical protein